MDTNCLCGDLNVDFLHCCLSDFTGMCGDVCVKGSNLKAFHQCEELIVLGIEC